MIFKEKVTFHKEKEKQKVFCPQKMFFIIYMENYKCSIIDMRYKIKHTSAGNRAAWIMKDFSQAFTPPFQNTGTTQ